MSNAPLERENSSPEPAFEEPSNDMEESISRMPAHIRESFSAFMALVQTAPVNKVSEKLTEEHIGKILDASEKEDERAHSRFMIERMYSLILLGIGLGAAIFLLVFFKDSQYFSSILLSVFSFLGGLGIGRFSKRKNNVDDTNE